jgi:myo-inositol-1-phosphate synthase
MTQQNIRVGIVGVGNCARALVEGIAWYRATPSTAGLMHRVIGGYEAGGILPVAAWDIDAEKVGKKLPAAIQAGQNLPVGIDAAGLDFGGMNSVTVHRGPTHDGAGDAYLKRIHLADDWPTYDGKEIIEQIRDEHIDLLINYLPVGSQDATEWWAQTALQAGCGLVNCIPVFIARRGYWLDRFHSAGLVLLGDDIKSQLGATYLHRAIVKAFSDRGIILDRTYQLNAGGNMDFWNMTGDQDRLGSKRESKTAAVLDAYAGRLDPAAVHIGPSDYVEWLGDTKRAFIRCEGRGFAGAPITIDMTITVPDSPNSAGVVMDAVRVGKLAQDRGDPKGASWASAWLFKAPPRDVALLPDPEALARLEAWLA